MAHWHVWLERFDGHCALEPHVLCAVDHAHAALTNLFEDAVMSQHAADLESVHVLWNRLDSGTVSFSCQPVGLRERLPNRGPRG